jgi:hypothetical protein
MQSIKRGEGCERSTHFKLTEEFCTLREALGCRPHNFSVILLVNIFSGERGSVINCYHYNYVFYTMKPAILDISIRTGLKDDDIKCKAATRLETQKSLKVHKHEIILNFF